MINAKVLKRLPYTWPKKQGGLEMSDVDSQNPNFYGVGSGGDLSKEPRSDREIENEIIEAIDNTSDLKNSDLDVIVENGVARIMGTAESPQAKELFEDIVQNIPGVREVENAIELATDH
jgi:osmotically-inducible protein OsmY